MANHLLLYWKSCVLLNNEKSDRRFGSYAGVREGGILSEHLFALYINYLEGFLRNKGVQPAGGFQISRGEVVDFNYYERVLFLDLLTLFMLMTQLVDGLLM